jgi:DNA-binding CsgD family transcriptional regulator
VELNLTRKEIKCATLALSGLSRDEIALKMFVTKRSINYHIENIKKKTNAKNLIQLGAKLRAHMGEFPQTACR